MYAYIELSICGNPSRRGESQALSGVVGIIHLDGAPVDIRQLRTMTDFLGYRGPDGSDTFVGDGVGLGNAMLRNKEILSGDGQPMRLNSLWITADVRLDRRTELINKLVEAGDKRVAKEIPDAMLLLRAYAAWGPGCVGHLRGDFSFGIWDSATRSLFCARDHFGIKPFYYANLGKIFLFSNTLNCLRQHPLVTKELNDAAIGDFLLFGLNYDNSTTTYRDIQRLPPAHWLVVSGDGVQIESYWRPPTEGHIRYTRTDDYLDQFTELLKRAVEDRTRWNKAGILLSGGMDSGSVAVVANELSGSCGGTPQLYSYTLGYGSFDVDDEGQHARMTARYLNIPHKYLSLKELQPFAKWDEAKYRSPEPGDDPISARVFDLFQTMASDCRVVLSGEGADNLMYFQMWPYIKDLQRNRQWGRLVTETAWFLAIRPFPWRGIASRIRTVFGKVKGPTAVPPWIDPEFVKRMDLEARWKGFSGISIPANPHASRPVAHASLLIPQWTRMFEMNDPGVTHFPVEVSYPFLDLNLVEYLLAIPVFPWAFRKKLERKAMRGKLPDEILRRKKTPVREDAASSELLRKATKGLRSRTLDGRIFKYVIAAKLSNGCDRIEVEEVWPYCLSLWLSGSG
jgi:asparagine synthase (glutamine-hydrolysing)